MPVSIIHKLSDEKAADMSGPANHYHIHSFYLPYPFAATSRHKVSSLLMK